MVTLFRRLALLSACAAAPATAASFQDLEALEVQVTASLGAGIGEPGGPARPIDRRLKLTPCPAPAVVQAPAMGAVAIVCEPIGWRIRMLRVGGGAATPAAQAAVVRNEPIVRRGDQVELVAGGGTFMVSTLAIAEQDGAEGDRIRVRSADRKTPPVIGEVTPEGRVALPGFR